MSDLLAHDDLRPRLLELLFMKFSPLRSSAEMLARASERTPRAAKNWLSGQNAPDAPALIELMASCEELADQVNALVAARRRAREGSRCRGSD